MIRAEKASFVYQYDFGDDWEHTILVEKLLAAEPDVTYPRCIAGKRACPPEDCGGAWGYTELLKTLSDPQHESHDEMVEWAGGEFDPEALYLPAINAALQALG